MICSLFMDVVGEAVRTLGYMPRKFFIKADNTRKETKNTIVVFACAWLLAQLEYTDMHSLPDASGGLGGGAV